MEEQLPITFYQTTTWSDVQVRVEGETIWLSEQQMAQVFGVDRSVIGKHIRKIYQELELNKQSNVQKMPIANADRPVNFYNLDIIIGVGYKVGSKQGTEFRRRATDIVKQYAVNWYALNHDRLKDTGLIKFRQTLEFLKKSVEQMELWHNELESINSLILDYASTWVSLYQYDTDTFGNDSSFNQSDIIVTAQLLADELQQLKSKLMKDGTATDLFAQEKYHWSLDGIIGNIYQSFDGQDLYTSFQSKAVHLLYFVIKDHPFNDGNKRSGAFLFILLLKKYWLLYDHNGITNINDTWLTAITLLIAQSNPKDKELMIELVIDMITK